MNKKINPPIAIAIILFTASVFAFFIFKINGVEAPAEIKNQSKECPALTKFCSDGSRPKMDPETCEFEPCPEEPQKTGGECAYDKIPGTCKISSILSDDTIRFFFAESAQLPDNGLAKNLKNEQSGALDDLVSTPNEKIKIGDVVECEASLITKGTCTPVIFKFIK